LLIKGIIGEVNNFFACHKNALYSRVKNI